MTGKYFEDLNVGDRFSTVGRTITETDIVQFLNLTRNLEPIFSDREYYEQSGPFKRLAAPGALTYAIAIGLYAHLGLFSGTGMGYLGMDEFRLPKPLFCGDTLRMEVTVVDKKPTSRGDRGVVIMEFTGKNQSDEVVMTARQTFMFACRPRA